MLLIMINILFFLKAYSIKNYSMKTQTPPIQNRLKICLHFALLIFFVTGFYHPASAQNKKTNAQSNHKEKKINDQADVEKRYADSVAEAEKLAAGAQTYAEPMPEFPGGSEAM